MYMYCTMKGSELFDGFYHAMFEFEFINKNIACFMGPLKTRAETNITEMCPKTSAETTDIQNLKSNLQKSRFSKS